MGLLLEAEILIPTSKVAGFSLGLFCILNPDHVVRGFTFNTLIGKSFVRKLNKY